MNQRLLTATTNDKTKSQKCCICGKKFKGIGNNPYPLITESEIKCCDECNVLKVIPARDPSVSVEFLVNYYELICYCKGLYNGRY